MAFLKPALVGFPDFSGLWNRGCQQCHATAPQPQLAGMDTRVAELGIACEACHGPAEEHVRQNRDPQRRYGYYGKEEGDPTIVNPRRLAADRSAEVCGQCHSLWQAVDTSEQSRSAAGGFSYRPGDELIKSKFVFHRANRRTERMRSTLAEDPHYIEDRFWPDGVVRVAGREYTALLDTKCFNHDDPGKERMTCLHCHVMHKPVDDPRPLVEWANDQLGRNMEGNQACLQCHSEFEDLLEEHTHHAADSMGSVCYNCHMPYTSYALLKGIRNHTIDSPSVTSSVQAGRPNACNQCHVDRTLGWAADHLQEWYGRDRPRLTEEQESVAASVLWVLTGDAGQRALAAWCMGWGAAREASGSDWMIPFLGQLLPDPYDAVRYIAGRSLRSLPGLSGFEYDFMGSESHRVTAFAKVVQLWRQRRERTTGPQLLIDETGGIDEKRWEGLLSRRNLRRVSLEE